MLITDDDVSEYEVHKFCAFRSDLGLRTSQWPELIPTTLGNKQPFIREGITGLGDGENAAVVYRQGNGCIWLKLFND